MPVTAKFFPLNSPPTWPINFPSTSNKVIEVADGTPRNGANNLKGDWFSSLSRGAIPARSNLLNEVDEILIN